MRGYRTIALPISGRGKCTLWVADSESKKYKGLRGVTSLSRKQGMIFVYEKPVHHSFTMKGVKIPLLMLFLDKDFNIMEKIKAYPGQGNILSQKPYSYVIELGC